MLMINSYDQREDKSTRQQCFHARSHKAMMQDE